MADLPFGVYARVRSAAARNFRFHAENSGCRAFQFALYRTFLALFLKSGKTSAVVTDKKNVSHAGAHP